MSCKIALLVSTAICLGIGVITDASYGLAGLVILNILVGVFSRTGSSNNKSNQKTQNAKQQQKQRKNVVDSVELTQNVIAACTEVIHDYKRIPAYVVYEKQKMIEIGIMTKYRRFIPLFKMVKGQVVPLTQAINEDVPPMLMQTVQIQDSYPKVMPPPQPTTLPPNYTSYPQGDNYYEPYQNKSQR